MDKEILSPGIGMGTPAAVAAVAQEEEEHRGGSHKAGTGPAGWSVPGLVPARRTRSARLPARERVWFPAGGAGGTRAGGDGGIGPGPKGPLEISDRPQLPRGSTGRALASGVRFAVPPGRGDPARAGERVLSPGWRKARGVITSEWHRAAGRPEDHIGPREKGQGAAAKARPAGLGAKTGAKASKGQGCQRSPARHAKRARVAQAARARASLGRERDAKARKGTKHRKRMQSGHRHGSRSDASGRRTAQRCHRCHGAGQRGGRGRRGAGTPRDPGGPSAKVERTPVPVLSATLPTEDAIWSFFNEGEKGGIGSRCRHYWHKCSWRWQ